MHLSALALRATTTSFEAGTRASRITATTTTTTTTPVGGSESVRA
jgi:hypothetical protein